MELMEAELKRLREENTIMSDLILDDIIEDKKKFMQSRLNGTAKGGKNGK